MVVFSGNIARAADISSGSGVVIGAPWRNSYERSRDRELHENNRSIFICGGSAFGRTRF
jgi:hypothetical protein